jgi:hypothetical protein
MVKENKSFTELHEAQEYQKKMRLEHPKDFVGMKITRYRGNIKFMVYIKHWINEKWR